MLESKSFAFFRSLKKLMFQNSLIDSKMNWLIVVLIVFQFESLKAASNWFVSPTGNDKFDGSQEKPFLTINHANTVATDKDTITLFPGVYSGKILIKKKKKILF